jgi:hypothetical protein
MIPLLKRIAAEKRPVVLPLAVAILANILAYGFIVYPLSVKSAGAADRAATAQKARQEAEREESLARALVSGKSRADEELSSFYQKVLPADQSAARRMTYATLPALARRTNVRYDERRFNVEDVRSSDPGATLKHLTIRMILQGEYENLREFIYQLESAPDFLIIDDVTLVEGNSEGGLQTLTIELSTYFRQRPNGA